MSIRKHAFTLSEILIAVGIIGVVSALTVPTVISNYQRKAFATQFRKVVNEFESATELSMTDEAKAKFSYTSYYANLNDFVTKNFKTLKSCAANTSGSCFASNYESINGSSGAAFTCDNTSYVLANSAVVCLSKTTSFVKVVVDINGTNDPNIGGRDMFTFYIDKDTGLAKKNYDSSTCLTSTSGNGCYELLAIDHNWQMNY